MTTITRENAEIKSFITGFLSDPAHDNQSSDSLLANVFRIALASLEAEPVSQTYNLPQTHFEQVADLYEMQFDDGRTCAFHTDAQKAAQWLRACDGNRVQEYVKLERLQNALSGNSPVIPDSWISCSERMPEMGERQCYVLAADFKNNYPPSIPNTQVGVYGDWFNDGKPTWDDGGGEDLYLKEVTHWMPLPEPPQEVNRG
ncbi:DUF551 domain-containing protein [Escherichia coli]|uniref:DUF551 domain-containing protein n=1 Tax=Escherichia coli TaxID=562 RepID=UPI0003399841|nr:DUF551 domain-containing protein [Escherichia coli]EHI3938179.1 DUF551 domain-containing protein [Shigella sonnei]EFF7023647.1 DUF551 domain-containing protein [Escherichia coli]EHR7664641.1 DUF551 domain-containing protein [Escherichia coli]EIH8040789.1 DUF551 domain-containing protein [Escherichia coli]EIH8173679.1 DUF551 domain-containing protein [Escherichia coli]